jgi:hypothetical protein
MLFQLQLPKLLNNPQSIKVLSFLVGFGIIVLMCHKPIRTHLVLGVPVSDIERKSIKSGGQCFQYRAEDAKCEFSDSK